MTQPKRDVEKPSESPESVTVETPPAEPLEALVEALAEGAPPLETPEKPETPEEAPRDDETPLETPEAPAPPSFAVERLEREDWPDPESDVVYTSGIVSRSETSPHWLTHGPVVMSPEEAAALDPESRELLRHVARNPVHSHAPAWSPREPNSP